MNGDRHLPVLAPLQGLPHALNHCGTNLLPRGLRGGAKLVVTTSSAIRISVPFIVLECSDEQRK